MRINLHIANHIVSLDVPAEHESAYRKAAVLLNERYNVNLRRQPKASPELLWLYVALESAFAYTLDTRSKDLAPVMDKVNELTELINNEINK